MVAVCRAQSDNFSGFIKASGNTLQIVMTNTYELLQQSLTRPWIDPEQERRELAETRKRLAIADMERQVEMLTKQIAFLKAELKE